MTELAEITSNPNGGPELLSLNDLITERRALYQQLCGGRVALLTQVALNLHRVYLPAVHIEKLLLNLITHARYNMPFGGTILLITSNVVMNNPDWPAAAERYAEPYVRLVVKTTRNPPDGTIPIRLPGYWDRKFSSKVVRAIVSANGGYLASWQESEIVSATEVVLPVSVSVFQPSNEKRSTALPT